MAGAGDPVRKARGQLSSDGRYRGTHDLAPRLIHRTDPRLCDRQSNAASRRTPMWQPDGWAWRARLGLLMQPADIGPESEFRVMAPDGVSIHAARIPLQMTAPGAATDSASAYAAGPGVDEAAALLAAAPLHAIVFCFTSSSYVRGAAADAALKARLEQRTRGIPVVI